jgi:hypothetical protein
MCYNCYHRVGRKKKAWLCEHSHKPHYAHGLCNKCYQNRKGKDDSRVTVTEDERMSNNDCDIGQ